MALNAEQIHAALFARLSTIASLTASSKKSRRALSWDDIDAEHQPALVCLAESAFARRNPGQPSIWTLSVFVAFAVRDPSDPAQTVETTLFTIIDQVDTALAKKSGEFSPDDDPGTTLGLSNVFRCFRKDYQIDHGVNEGQAAVSMHIEIVAIEP